MIAIFAVRRVVDQLFKSNLTFCVHLKSENFFMRNGKEKKIS
jgi:hypothetical protein